MSLQVYLYDNRALTAAVNKLNVPEPFVINNIFKRKEVHNSDKIDIEIFNGSEKIAKPTSRGATQPLSIANQSKTVKTISLLRTWESKIFDAHELADMNTIGAIYGNDADKRLAQADAVNRELADLKNRVLRLREKLACEALATGKISVSTDNMDVEYDFEFVATKQLVTLTGAELWTASTAKPLKNLHAWKRDVMKRSGVAVKFLLLGTAAADAFVSNADVAAALDTNNKKVGTLDLTGEAGIGATYIGRVAGIDVYEYSQQYVDEAGVAVDMIAADRAVAVGSTDHFRLHSGPAYRIENGVAVPKYAEYYLEIDDKSGSQSLQWNLEQKSIPAIHDPGAVISAKVV